jgi:hypothetical protein
MTKQQITPLPNTYFGSFMHNVSEYTGIASVYRTIEKAVENTVITTKYIAGTAVVSVGISTGAIQGALRGTATVADTVVAPVNNVAQYVVEEGVKAAVNLLSSSSKCIDTNPLPESVAPGINATDYRTIEDAAEFFENIKQTVWDELINLPTRATTAVNYLQNNAIKNATELGQYGIDLVKDNPYTTAGVVVGVAGLATAAYLGHSYYQQYCLEEEKKQLPDTLLEDVNHHFEILDQKYRELGLRTNADTYEKLVENYINTNPHAIDLEQVNLIQNSLKTRCSIFTEDKLKELHDCSVNLITSLQLHQRFQEQELAQQADRKFVDQIKEEREQLKSRQRT